MVPSFFHYFASIRGTSKARTTSNFLKLDPKEQNCWLIVFMISENLFKSTTGRLHDATFFNISNKLLSINDVLIVTLLFVEVNRKTSSKKSCRISDRTQSKLLFFKKRFRIFLCRTLTVSRFEAVSSKLFLSSGHRRGTEGWVWNREMLSREKVVGFNFVPHRRPSLQTCRVSVCDRSFPFVKYS